MASIADVAELAGVSTATVSRTLSGRAKVNEETRSRVLLAAEQLGYVASAAASSLASGRTKNVGVLMPYLDRWYFSKVLNTISSTLMEYGYDVTLYQIPVDEYRRRQVFNHFIMRGRVDALISVSLEFSAFETSRLLELGLPTVIVGGNHENFYSLNVNHDELSRIATEHLIELGHERIVYIGGEQEAASDFGLTNRRRCGFVETMRASGLEPNENYLLKGDFSTVGGYLATKQVLSRPEPNPTAIFAANDEMALGAILAANELGLEVPEDLSIIGIDGHELGAFFGLTTVDINVSNHGTQAALTILQQLNENVENLSESLEFKLVQRNSTIPARRGPRPIPAVKAS